MFEYTVLNCSFTADYDGALSTLTEITNLIVEKPQLTGGTRPIGIYSDTMAKTEISKVLLLLLLQVNIFTWLLNIWMNQ
jgi:hypothetical protein